jgi:Kef-type K+ transport system membrane component KefB
MEALLEQFSYPDSMVQLAVLLAAIMLVPALCRRVHVPGLVGLVAVGALLGPHALGVFPAYGPVADFIADMGKLLLLFLAGLEIDIEQFARTRHRSLIYGVLGFALPMAAGLIVARAFNYMWTTAFMLGSLSASHTHLA